MICALTLVGAPSFAEPTLLSDFVWESPQDTFGGISGVVISPDGTRLLAITDRSRAVTVEITRTDGAITSVETSPTISLNTLGGFEGTNRRRDSEGLSYGPDGRIYISFEGVARVAAYDTIDSAPDELPIHPAFPSLVANGSLEALAIDADGAIYTMPERSGLYSRPFPVYRFQNGQWDIPFRIPRVGSYLIVGADFGPQGRLYILERAFSGIGFRTRVRRLDIDTMTLETLLETPNTTHGNLEGISVWENPSSETIITMVADDNFHFLLQTEIVEYRLKD